MIATRHQFCFADFPRYYCDYCGRRLAEGEYFVEFAREIKTHQSCERCFAVIETKLPSFGLLVLPDVHT